MQCFGSSLTSTVAPGVQSFIAVDLSYILLRNRFWISAPIFCELLVEYLSDEYFLPREIAISLAEDLVCAAQSLPGEQDKPDIGRWITHHGKRDKEFLTYVFVATATATNEDQLILDLGLGTRLLRRIKAAAESAIQLSTQQKSTDTSEPDPAVLVFVPEIESLFAQIMTDLSREARLTPWAMDIHRVRFHLLRNLPGSTATRDPRACSSEFASSLFQFLLTLGKARQLGEDALDKMLLEYALSADMAFVMDCGKRFGKPFRTIALTPPGEDITATAFAEELLPRVLTAGRLDTELILTLPARYQLSVVKALATHSRHLLADLIECYLGQPPGNAQSLSAPKHLSACALDASLRHLMPQLTSAESQQLFTHLLSESRPVWIRTTTCSAMGHSGKSQYVRQLLKKVAESDNSTNVREAAQLSIIQLESTS